MDRRTWLRLAASAAAAAALPRELYSQTPQDQTQPFTEDQLDAFARDLANKPYVAPEKHVDDVLANLNYDQYKDIRYDQKNSIWRNDNLEFRLDLFQTGGANYAFPVEVSTVEAGRAALFRYSPQLFNFGPLAKAPPPNSQSGFAGFSVRSQINNPAVFDEFLVFLGASYFRAIASGQVFGLSARGLAINTGQPGGEEFPLFRAFWIERPKPSEQRLVIHALLDSVSTVGRYKFIATPGRDTVIETETVIYPRKRIPYIGIAPLTSMFFAAPDAPSKKKDFRPRVHDSEALSMLNGAGEWIWRPLINPERLQFSVFVDKNPKGFGLIQRDRSFGDYQDLEAQYDRRPSLWIEPVGDWGEGAIDLIELPAQDEYNDNVVCFWRPKDGFGPGIGHRFHYKMHWCWESPVKSNKASIAQTRLGETKGGDAQFIVDFAGTESCEGCTPGPLTPTVTASGGEIKNIVLSQNPRAGGHRLAFQYAPSGSQPTDLRAVLMAGGRAVSETWIFRWTR